MLEYLRNLAFSFLLLFIVLVTVLGIIQVGAVINRKICRDFGRESGRTVIFARSGYADWECLVRTDNGRWAPASELAGTGAQEDGGG